MDWDKLRIFHIVAETKSLTGAGIKLNSSQSAVSRQISALEKELKVNLFNRHARGLVFTPEGEILYETTRKIFSIVNITQTKITDLRDGTKGILKIAATTAIGSVWLPARLNRFLGKYPDLQTHFILTDGDVDFTMREVDLSIKFGKSKNPPPGMIHQHLFPVNMRIYGSKAYFKKHGVPQSTENLSQHQLLIFGTHAEAPIDSVNILLKLGAKSHEIRTPYIQLPNAFGLLQCVQSGLGIALLADYIARDYEDLIPIFPEISLPMNEMIMVYPEELAGLKRIQLFLEFMRKETSLL